MPHKQASENTGRRFQWSLFVFQLILVSVLNAFYDAISQMLRKNVEKRALMDNLDGVVSIVDEIVDGG